MTRKPFAFVLPANHDRSAVDRILRDAKLLNNAARPTIRCRPKNHPLGWVFRVEGELVFVGRGVRQFSAPVFDLPMSRQAWERGGEWSNIGDSAFYNFLEATATASWGVECKCGVSEIRRPWLLEQVSVRRRYVHPPNDPTRAATPATLFDP
jgi:hypothetical protein